ncbi:MAG TPA: sigma-70 family RNA polymerase sigma factor [Anaerolineales bacterium]|nr:sigma-70 family RNA polymerase sigma factor [Anaerolineales bacterium]
MNAANEQTQPSEALLVRSASEGDLEAFNRLVLKYQDLAYHHAYALLGDPAAAEDAAQDSFIRAFQNLSGFRGGSFRAWILKIVTNTAYDLLRRSKRHPSLPLFPEDEYGEEIESPVWLADPGPSTPEIVEQKEFAQEIYRILDELPEAYRSVIMLVDLQGLDYEEAATTLSIPIGTVKSRLARARLQMQEKLRSRPEYAGNLRMAGAGGAL